MKAEDDGLIELVNTAGLMHPTKLQNIALRMGNGQWCRHWYNWGEIKEPWVMAIQSRTYTGIPIGCRDLIDEGFVMWKDCIYLIRRADDEGSPFIADKE